MLSRALAVWYLLKKEKAAVVTNTERPARESITHAHKCVFLGCGCLGPSTSTVLLAAAILRDATAAALTLVRSVDGGLSVLLLLDLLCRSSCPI